MKKQKTIIKMFLLTVLTYPTTNLPVTSSYTEKIKSLKAAIEKLRQENNIRKNELKAMDKAKEEEEKQFFIKLRKQNSKTKEAFKKLLTYVSYKVLYKHKRKKYNKPSPIKKKKRINKKKKQRYWVWMAKNMCLPFGQRERTFRQRKRKRNKTWTL